VFAAIVFVAIVPVAATVFVVVAVVAVNKGGAEHIDLVDRHGNVAVGPVRIVVFVVGATPSLIEWDHARNTVEFVGMVTYGDDTDKDSREVEPLQRVQGDCPH